MTPELWQRLKPLFDEALDRPPEERAAFAAEVCGGDAELHRELLALMEAHDRATATVGGMTQQMRSAAASALHFLQPGEVIQERFDIVRLLGSGGMGDVYEAFDRALSETIALKTIRPEIAGSPELLSRFKKEVQLARRLSGPNVCRIHELIVPQEGAGTHEPVFFTMEFLNGQTLAESLKQSGPVSWRDAGSIAGDLCNGLAAMHREGILHRDIKCRNIMLMDRKGVRCAVLMDFGLAREMTTPANDQATGLTVPGSVLGTPEYMAPEQFLGKEATAATDIYALGVVLYEMVTAKHPFPSSNPVGAALLRAKPPTLASSIQHSLPRRWDHVLAKCLEYEPSRRYQSAEELAKALDHPISFLPNGRAGFTFPRRPAAWLALALCVALAGIAIYVTSRPTYKEPPDEAKRWYELGKQQLRDGAYFQATEELNHAVQVDPNFALAHARLAEAWAELDYSGTAQHEMLLISTPEMQKGLPRLDREYIEAVRATLTHDFAGAVKDYSEILKALPADQKGYGYVDLGRAQEKARDNGGAIRSFEAAAAIQPDNPTLFVHLGALRSKRLEVTKANDAFRRAEDIYTSKSNNEGLAEVAYQRGVAANDRNDFTMAKEILGECLKRIEKMPSPDIQLRLQTLLQLSAVADLSDHDDEAIRLAEQVIQEAGENHIEYQETEGWIRKGNAYYGKNDYASAETALQLGLRQAEANKHERLTAMAQFSLASVRDQQQRPGEQIELALSALKYYRAVGFTYQITQATDIYVRGLEGKGYLDQALPEGMAALLITKRQGIPVDLLHAEANVGNVLVDLQRYPEALGYFEQAFELSEQIHQEEPYHALHIAEVSWRLGNYPEAEAKLKLVAPAAQSSKGLAQGRDLTEAGMELSQQHFKDALKLADRNLARLKDGSDGMRYSFQRVKVLAETGLGHGEDAVGDAQPLRDLAQATTNEETVADAELVEAKVLLKSHRAAQARPMVETAYRYFSGKNELEMQWMSLACRAETESELGDVAASQSDAKKAIDILNHLHQTWTSSVYGPYSSRPDIRDELQSLSRLSSQ